MNGVTPAVAPETNMAMVLKLLADRAEVATDVYLKWIKASVGSTVRLIPVEEILYFQSDEKYTRVVMNESEVLVRKPIKDLLEDYIVTGGVRYPTSFNGSEYFLVFDNRKHRIDKQFAVYRKSVTETDQTSQFSIDL